MAKISRYDSPAESNYFNTFVPLPLDQITALGMKRQEDLERKQDTASKYIDQASLVDYIANSKDEQWVKSEYLPTLQKYAEDAMSVDLSNPVEWAKYSTKLRSHGTSDKIRRIEESKARWNQAQEMKQKLIAAGRYNQMLDEDPSVGWDSTTGIYNYMPEAYTDKSELFEQYYKHMKPQSKGIVTLAGGVKALREGIDMNDVRSISDRAAQELAATPQGQQQIKLFHKMYPEIAKDMSNVDILRTQMEDYGQQYITSNDQILPEFAQGIGSGSDMAAYDLIPVRTAGEGLDLDPAGVNDILASANIDMSGSNAMSILSSGPGGGKAAVLRYNNDASSMTFNRSKKAIEAAAQKVIAQYPEFSKGPNGEILTSEQIISNYKTAIDDWKNSSSMVYSFGNDQVNAEWNNRVANTIQHRTFIIPGKETPVSFKDAAKYYGYKPEEFVKALADPNNPSVKVNAPSINARGEGWSSMQIVPKNRKNTFREDIKISASEDESPYLRTYYNIQNSIKSDKPIPTIVGGFSDGRKIVAVPNKRLGYDETGHPTLDISISEYMTDPNGNIIGDPLARDKKLNDYYYESLKALTRNLHLDKDTKGLTLE